MAESKFVTQDRVVLHVMANGKEGGKGTALEPLSIDRHGFTGKTDNTIPGRGQVFGRDAWGNFRVKLSYSETPGGLMTGTLEFEKRATLDYLEDRVRDQEEFAIWEFYSPCARLDNPQGWLSGGRLDYHGRMFVTGNNPGDGPVREASGLPVVNSVPVSWDYDITFLPVDITSIAPTAAAGNDAAFNSIFGLDDEKMAGCSLGYNGPGKHMTAVGDAAAGEKAALWVTTDGGSTWAEHDGPFAVDEDISDGDERITTGESFRRVVGRLDTDISNPAEIGYSDYDFGAESTASWTTVNVGSTNAEVVTVIEWLFYNRMYAIVGAVGGEDQIYVSTDQGASWTRIYNPGSGNAFNCMAKGYGQDCKDVYFGGDSNTIVREVDQSGTIEVLVGPSGGGAFTALAFANDGLLFAGNGQKLYVSDNEAKNTGGWTEVYDFGAGYTVKRIFLPKGDSNHIYCVIDDGTNARLYHSNDGGATWNGVTTLANDGYNDAFALVDDPNKYWIVGEVESGASSGTIHYASPSVTGC